MANIIKIKRSATTATPTSLQEGELAYSENSGNLFIGTNGGLDVTKIGGNTDVLKLAGIEAGAQVNTVDSVNGQTGVVSLGIEDLSDVTTMTPSSGDLLTWNVGGYWENVARSTFALDSAVVHNTGDESIGGNKTFSNNVIVTGDLTVNGTTTSVNSTVVDIADNMIILNSGETGAGVTLGVAGIEIERGTATNAVLQFNETTDSWEAGISGSETNILLDTSTIDGGTF